MDEIKKEKQPMWKKIEDGLPLAGIPLAVKTKPQVIEDWNKPALKYPVYRIKDPYTFDWKWVFLPATEGMSVLLPEYSEVVEWAYIEDFRLFGQSIQEMGLEDRGL